jgi:Raf kinase inhibitor-like YbhB/YbcL family protein
MNLVRRGAVSIVVIGAVVAAAVAQAPQSSGQRDGSAGERDSKPRTTLSVTSTSWPDGGEIPLKHAYRGGNRSPAFKFHWRVGPAAAVPPKGLRTYAVTFRDLDSSTNRGTGGTLHWTLFNIPGTATGLPEGLESGDLTDGTRNGPGLGVRGRAARSYLGPGAAPAPGSHYVFEVFALDTRLDLPGTATREQLMRAMEGHVIGKAAYVGRFRAP